MDIYLATSLSNIETARSVAAALCAAGHRITYRWFDHGPAGDKGQAHMTQISVLEARGVRDAQAVVVILPGGRGTHAELGMAIALRKPILLWDTEGGACEVNNQTCAFYHHPAVAVKREGPLQGDGGTNLALLVFEVGKLAENPQAFQYPLIP